jgi:anti-anti-sigma regulatory factor
VLDLSGVSFFSSSGAALLIALATDTEQTAHNCT